MRSLILLLVSAFWAGAASAACDMDISSRHATVDQYVLAGQACLETPPEPLRFDETMERAFIDRINDARKAEGLAPLERRADLRAPARFHSLDMASNDFFNHQSPDGRRAHDRIAAFDRTLLAQSTAENIAAFGSPTCFDQFEREVSCFMMPGFKVPTESFVVDDLHEKLMNSESHRRNILANTATHVAVGVARSDTGFYVTQVFANQIGRLEQPLPLHFEPSQRLPVKPDLAGWGLGGLSLIADDERIELKTTRLRKVPDGDYMLIVRGENVREEQRGARTFEVKEWLDLSGPSFSVVSAKES
ncbi:MAG: CAP domain-containing protein [Pseudomonadota bacterium]